MLRRLSLSIIVALMVLGVLGALEYGSLEQAKARNSGSENTTTVYVDYNQIVLMPSSTVNARLDCAGTLIAEGDWTGVKLGLVLAKAGVKPEAESLEFHASDGYTYTISHSTAMRDDVIIAYELNGTRLPEGLRLVIPNAPGYQWICKITSFVVRY